jgi:Flp pilus assembly protein TadG
MPSFALLAPRTARHRSRLLAWAQARRGATAVEFALILLPFLVLMMGILEVAIMFFVASTLEAAVGESARLIRTGQFQADPQAVADPVGVFREEVGRRTFGMINLDDGLYFDVRTFSDFDSVNANSGLQDIISGNPPDTFDPGGAEEIVVVRAYYEWQIMTPLMAPIMANLGGDRRVVAASAAFRNEPFAL